MNLMLEDKNQIAVKRLSEMYNKTFNEQDELEIRRLLHCGEIVMHDWGHTWNLERYRKEYEENIRRKYIYDDFLTEDLWKKAKS